MSRFSVTNHGNCDTTCIFPRTAWKACPQRLDTVSIVSRTHSLRKPPCDLQVQVLLAAKLSTERYLPSSIRTLYICEFMKHLTLRALAFLALRSDILQQTRLLLGAGA